MIFGPTLTSPHLAGLGDGEAHPADAGFVHQIHDQFQFVQAFKIRHLRLVARLHQRLEAGLNQRGCAAAQHGLFAEQIGFRFLLEGGLENAGARGAYALGPRQRDLLGILARVLVNA